jgi:hypothetical protein
MNIKEIIKSVSVVDAVYQSAAKMIKKNLDPFQYIYVMHLVMGYKIKISKMNKPNCFQVDLFMPPSVKPTDRIFLTPDGPKIEDPTV